MGRKPAIITVKRGLALSNLYIVFALFFTSVAILTANFGNERMHPPGGVGRIHVPQRVSGPAAAVQHAHARPRHQAPAQAALPRHHAGIRRVVEGVLGVAHRHRILRAQEPGVAKIERLRARRDEAQRAFHAGKLQVVDVQGLPDTVERGAVVIDAVPRAPAARKPNHDPLPQPLHP